MRNACESKQGTGNVQVLRSNYLRKVAIRACTGHGLVRSRLQASRGRRIPPKFYIVQPNVRFGFTEQHSTFDLKGLEGRRAPPSGPGQGDDRVLWDEKIRDWTQGRGLSLGSQDLDYVESTFKNDTRFLSGQNLVD